MTFGALETALKFDDFPWSPWCGPEFKAGGKWRVIRRVLGPSNYSETVGWTFQKADSWQKGVNSHQKSKMDKLPRSRLPLTRRGRRIDNVCKSMRVGFLDFGTSTLKFLFPKQRPQG